MRALILGDMHLRASAPESRSDDFVETQFGKVRQALEIAKKQGCRAVFQPGDLCDHPHLPKYLISRYIRLMREYPGITWFTVLGQHDIPMRNEESLVKTTDYLLESAGCVQILSSDKHIDIDGVHVYGAGYGETAPEPVTRGTNVLLVHASVGDRPLFPGQELTSPKSYLKAHAFNLIVVGDYHYTFEASLGDRHIVNAGCLVRKTACKEDRAHRPCVFVWESTEKVPPKQVLLKVAPQSEVYIDAAGKPDEGSNQYLSELLAALRSNRKLGSDFFANLDVCLKKEKPPEAVRGIIAEAVAYARQQKEGSA